MPPSSSPRARVAVLASGGGSNLQALLEHFERLGERRAADVVLVASDRAGAGAIGRAAARGIATSLLATPARPDGASLDALLRAHDVDLVVLAGYLRLVPEEVVRRCAGRMLNVHPALLPAFGGTGMYGLRVHQAVLDAGATVSGATVHLVDAQYDRGRIVAQWPVPVLAGDDAATLAARVLRVEHLLLPRVVDAVAAGRLSLDGSAAGYAAVPEGGAFALRSHDDRAIAEDMDRALRAPPDRR